MTEQENKPDFRAVSYKEEHALSGLRRNGFILGCEHVWSTYVVPLQKTLAGIDAFVDTRTDEYKREYAKLESENKSLRDELSDKAKACADLTILLSDEKALVNELREELERRNTFGNLFA